MPSNHRWRGCAVCLAPRAREAIARPRRLSGVVVRPLNFTVGLFGRRAGRELVVLPGHPF